MWWDHVYFYIEYIYQFGWMRQELSNACHQPSNKYLMHRGYLYYQTVYLQQYYTSPLYVSWVSLDREQEHTKSNRKKKYGELYAKEYVTYIYSYSIYSLEWKTSVNDLLHRAWEALACTFTIVRSQCLCARRLHLGLRRRFFEGTRSNQGFRSGGARVRTWGGGGASNMHILRKWYILTTQPTKFRHLHVLL